MVLSLLAILTFFIYNRLQRQAAWVQVKISVENSDWWWRGSPPQYWYAKDLQIGDSLLDSFGKPVAEIINIDNYDGGGPHRDIYVDLKVRVDHDKKKNQYLYEFKPLVVGSSLFFNFPEGQLRGLVVQLGEQQIDYFDRTVRVELKYVQQIHKSNPFFVTATSASQIEVGQQAYDADGMVVAEIMDVSKKPSTYYEFSDKLGRSVLVQNPDFYDVELVVKLKAFKAFEIDYFINKAALKVGNSIWLQFPEFALEDMRIIELLD